MKVVDITGHRLSTRKHTYMTALTPRLRQLADLRVFKGSKHGREDAQGPCMQYMRTLTCTGHKLLEGRTVGRGGKSLAGTLGLYASRCGLSLYTLYVYIYNNNIYNNIYMYISTYILYAHFYTFTIHVMRVYIISPSIPTAYRISNGI